MRGRGSIYYNYYQTLTTLALYISKCSQYMCSSISVMYCGLKGLSIFQSQLLQTIISCCSELRPYSHHYNYQSVFTFIDGGILSHLAREGDMFCLCFNRFLMKYFLQGPPHHTTINYKQLILTSS